MTEEIQIKINNEEEKKESIWNELLRKEREYRHQKENNRVERTIRLQQAILSPWNKIRKFFGLGPSKAEIEYEKLIERSNQKSEIHNIVRANGSYDYGLSKNCWEEIYIERSEDIVQKAYQMRISQYDEKTIHKIRAALLEDGIHTCITTMGSKTNQDIHKGAVVSGLYTPCGDDTLDIQEGDLVIRTSTPISAYYVRHNLILERIYGYQIDEDLLPMSKEKYNETRKKEKRVIERHARTQLLLATFFAQREQANTQDSDQEMIRKLSKFLDTHAEKSLDQIALELKKGQLLQNSV